MILYCCIPEYTIDILNMTEKDGLKREKSYVKPWIAWTSRKITGSLNIFV